MTKNIAQGYRESDERREFRASTRGMLARVWRDEVLRDFPDSVADKVAELHRDIHSNLGLGGILVADEYGGLGATCEYATVAAEELGAGLAPYDLVGACMTAQVLAGAEGPDRDKWLRKVAGDARPFVFAWPGSNASWSVGDLDLPSVTGSSVSGRVEYVTGPLAEALVAVPVTREGGLGIAVFDGAAAEGAAVAEIPRADTLRSVSHLSMTDVDAVVIPVAERAMVEAVAVGAILLAAEMVGAARSCIEKMVEYGLLRRQFGQPIVTFQALKHDVVDAAVDFERARASVYRAARRTDAMSAEGSDAELAEAVVFARIAKASAGTALRSAAKQSIQLHGGTGFTWENLSHRYLRKWLTGNELFGSTDAQRRLIYTQAQSELG